MVPRALVPVAAAGRAFFPLLAVPTQASVLPLAMPQVPVAAVVAVVPMPQVST